MDYDGGEQRFAYRPEGYASCGCAERGGICGGNGVQDGPAGEVATRVAFLCGVQLEAVEGVER